MFSLWQMSLMSQRMLTHPEHLVLPFLHTAFCLNSSYAMYHLPTLACWSIILLDNGWGFVFTDIYLAVSKSTKTVCCCPIKWRVHVTWAWYSSLDNSMKSSCGWADSVTDSHITGPRFKTRLVWYFLPSFLLTTTMTAS